jgi:hypothetical protein
LASTLAAFRPRKGSAAQQKIWPVCSRAKCCHFEYQPNSAKGIGARG